MQPTDRPAFFAMFTTLAGHYEKKVPADLLDLYFDTITDMAPQVTIEQVKLAAQRHLASSDFFPKIADFIAGIQGSPAARALEGWANFVGLVERVGYYGSPNITDPAMAYAIDRTFGSWPEACQLPDRSEPMFVAYEKQFVGHYKHAVETGKGEPKRLMGQCESENRANGWINPDGTLRVPGPPKGAIYSRHSPHELASLPPGRQQEIRQLVETIKRKADAE